MLTTFSWGPPLELLDINVRFNFTGRDVGEAQPWWVWLWIKLRITQWFLSHWGALLMFLGFVEGKQIYVYLTRLG